MQVYTGLNSYTGVHKLPCVECTSDQTNVKVRFRESAVYLCDTCARALYRVLHDAVKQEVVYGLP